MSQESKASKAHHFLSIQSSTDCGAGQSIGTLFDKSAARRLLQDQSRQRELYGNDPELFVPTANGHSDSGRQRAEGQQERKTAPGRSALSFAKSEPREKAQKAREAARILQSLDTKVDILHLTLRSFRSKAALIVRVSL